MSYAPQRLLDLREYLHSETGVSYSSLGIVGDINHTSGYHLGDDRLGPNDYSVTGSRDQAGLTDAASAIDIGMYSRLVEMTLWMVGEARAGRRPDTREIIGPAGDGRAYRWARENNWAPQIRANGDSHESHVHESFYRDSEFRDKIRFFSGFFGGDDMGDVYYLVQSSDPNFNGHKYVSNRVHRRKLRNPGIIREKATVGATEVVLTDADRQAVGPNETWESFLDSVAGGLFIWPEAICTCNCECNCGDGGGGGFLEHTHTVPGTVETSTGPAVPA